MSLVDDYLDARLQEGAARLRRLLALRALAATGSTQREIAAALGVSQSAVSQQLNVAREIANVHPATLVKAAAPILVEIASSRRFTHLAVFGSVARGTARAESDIDLLVEAPPDSGIRELVALRGTFQEILGRPVDLITYGGLKTPLDDDTRLEAVSL